MGNYDGQAQETCDGSEDQVEDNEGGEKSRQRKRCHEITANFKEGLGEKVHQTNGRREITGNVKESFSGHFEETGIPS